MKIFPMAKFGKTLTDREDGKKAFDLISSTDSKPYILDFEGVVSMGSSFGDEVILKLAKLQGDLIRVLNINDGIRASIKRVIEGTPVKVDI